MAIDLIQEVGVSPQAVARLRVETDPDGGFYSDLDDEWGRASDAGTIINRLQKFAFVASLAAALDLSVKNHPSAPFSPLEAAGDVAGFTAAAVRWTRAAEEIANAISSTAAGGIEPVGEGELPSGGAPINSLGKKFEQAVRDRDEAKYDTYAKVARIASATTEKVGADAHERWARRLVAGPLLEAEEASSAVNRVEKAFPLWAADAAANPDPLSTENQWRAITERAASASGRCRAARLAVAKTRWLALDAALEPFHPSEPEVLRVSYASPLEIVLAIFGGIGATVAVFDQVLDLEVKLRTHNSRIVAERLKLQNEIDENRRAHEALNDVRSGIPGHSPPIKMEVFESLADEQRDHASNPGADVD